MKTLLELKAQFLRNLPPTHSVLYDAKFYNELTRKAFQNQFEKIKNHKQNFDIADSPLLEVFEAFASRTQPDLIEPSVKISTNKIFPQRYNLYFCDSLKFRDIAGDFFKLFEDIEQASGCRFNYTVFAYLLNHNFLLQCCENLIVGIDLREDITASRLKTWFVLKNAKLDLKKYIYDYNSKMLQISPVLIERTDLFGIDYKFDETDRLKVYPGFWAEDLQKEQIKDFFGSKSRELIAIASSCLVAIFDSFSPIQITLSGEILAKLIDHEVINTLDKKTGYIVSLLPHEIETGEIKNFNLYY